MNDFEFKALKNEFPDCEIIIRMNKYKMEQYGELEEDVVMIYKDTELYLGAPDYSLEWLLKRANTCYEIMIEE